MPIDINIPDKDIQGFNQQAKDELKKCIQSFSNDIIAESNRIETSINTTSKGPEITSSIVADAQVLIRHKISKPKKNYLLVLLKVLASVASLAVGLMYQKDALQKSGYMVLFIVVIVIAIILITLSIILED